MNSQYLVVCLDNDKLVLGTRTVFQSKEQAENYCLSISQSRKPQVVHCQFKIFEHEESLRPPGTTTW